MVQRDQDEELMDGIARARESTRSYHPDAARVCHTAAAQNKGLAAAQRIQSTYRSGWSTIFFAMWFPRTFYLMARPTNAWATCPPRCLRRLVRE